MPCKHMGGIDPCVRYPSGGCKEVGRRSGLQNYKNMRRQPLGIVKASDRGAVAEHLVMADMLSRGLTISLPGNHNGPHDCFVRLGTWRTVQVKVGLVNTKTGHIKFNKRRDIILSDLIVLVDIENKRLRWISNTDEPVPPELLDEV